MIQFYLYGLVSVMAFMIIVWIVSLIRTDASIVDIVWGFTFILSNLTYLLVSGDITTRKIIVTLLVIIWGLRLSMYIWIRNRGKGEDFRYRQFRKDYGEKRYWWVSLFQVFLLQGILSWLISAPLAAIHFGDSSGFPNIFDIIALVVWISGFVFETAGDYQMRKFKKNPGNRGKIMDQGLWKYTRHPNYFGDAAIWWGFGLFCLGSGYWLPLLGPILMTLLLLRVSGVTLLEKTLSVRDGYEEYVNKTSAFIPWKPKK